MIEWNVSPEIFSLGPISIRWYSLGFMISFLFGYYIIQKIFRQELPTIYKITELSLKGLSKSKIPSSVVYKLKNLKNREFRILAKFNDALEKVIGKNHLNHYQSEILRYSTDGPEVHLDAIFIYVFAGTIIGARLGHCLFYDPVYYLSNPLKIFKVWEGGLASHGAAIGILTAIYFYAKNRKGQSFLWTADRVAIVVALAGFFIRLGNLFNSEIVGSPTDVPWAFVFPRFDVVNPVPRHPAQLYEALAYLAIFFFLYRTYRRKKAATEKGLLFGYFLTGIFGFRFFVEFFKEVQESWESQLPLTMGQFLSIPLVVLGIWLIWQAGERQTSV